MHADTAMYKAKEQGGSSYQTYSKSMTTTALQRMTLENDLRRALERNEFEVHYQPIVDAYTSTVVGAEALLRWRHPELGLLLPSEFIPIAEENGLIVPMGEWILQSACLQNRAWQDAGLPRIRVGVNLSSRQLKRTLTETIGRALQISGLEPRYLSLELTESVLVNHHKEGTEALHALRAMGLHLAVDDFGTGYSSFSYLKHFPLDTLKIDRSFIREIAIHPDDAAITTAIIAMGHALGLRVIAEGVETEAHLTLLQKQGCDEVQGYLVGRPVPSDRFVDHLARKRSGNSGPHSAAAVYSLSRRPNCSIRSYPITEYGSPCRQSSGEVRIHRPHRSRLDQNQARCIQGPSHECGYAVAGHLPGVGENVGRAHPAGRRQHRRAAERHHFCNRTRLIHQHCILNSLGEHVGVLIHGQNRHPVRRIGRHALPDARTPARCRRTGHRLE